MFILKDIQKTYAQSNEEVCVLKGLDLEIKEGEAIAITGASGVGKSTLLHILGGLDRPTKGRVLFRGTDLYGLSEKGLELIRNREMGFVFQFHYLLPEFTAVENVMMPALIGGMSSKKARELAMEALGMVGLREKAHRRPGELSGGEQQRVAIGRAIVQRPKVLLADEPTGNLDWATGEEISKMIVALNRDSGITLIVVTHNLRLASMMTRRMELIDGKIQELQG